MKPNKILANTKKALLCVMLPGLMAACKQDKDTPETIDEKITSTIHEINSTSQIQQQHAQSIAETIPMYSILKKWTDRDEAKVDSIRNRNYFIVDSVRIKRIERVAKQYPLSAFLSKKDLRAISSQAVQFKNTENAGPGARAIITGRGTLWDLYNISFFLDYNKHQMPFYISNEMGGVSFYNQRLDAARAKFDSQMWKIFTTDPLTKNANNALRKEYNANQEAINEHDRLCALVDSVYMDVMDKISPEYQRKIDSLNNVKEQLYIKRENLLMQRQK